MAKTNKRMGGMELLNKAVGAKKRAEGKLQNVGKTIRKNVEQGQKDYKAGKLGYKAINPFKGVIPKKESNTFKVGKKKVPYRNDNQKKGTYPKI